MNPIDSIILGATQGLTEFIPVSSSGHLTVVQYLLGGDGDNFHLFLEFINLGTLLALLFFFRKKIWRILTDIFRNHNYRLAANILITSVPAGIIGLLLAGLIESNAFFASVTTVAVAMLVVGVVMVVLEKLPRASAVRDGAHLSKPRALAIGLAQTAALVPGVSRSGATIIAGRLSGLSPSEAAEYSFLASIPIMCGVVGKTFISDMDYLSANLPSLALSNLVAFAAGVFALYFIFHLLKQRNSLAVFGLYRIAIATGLLLALVLPVQ